MTTLSLLNTNGLRGNFTNCRPWFTTVLQCYPHTT